MRNTPQTEKQSQIDKQSQSKLLDPIEKIIVVETLNKIFELNKAKSENLNLNPQDKAALVEKASIEAIIELLSLPYDPNKSSILTQRKEDAEQSKEAADKFSQELRDIYISKFMPIERRIEYLKNYLSPAMFNLLKDELIKKKHQQEEQQKAVYETLLQEFEKKEFAEQHNRESNPKEIQEFNLAIDELCANFDHECKDFHHEKGDHIEFLNNLSNDQKNTTPLLWAIYEFKNSINNKQAKIGENLGDNKTHIHSNKFIASLCAKYHAGTETDQKDLIVKIQILQRQLIKSHIEQKSSKEQTIVNKADMNDHPVVMAAVKTMAQHGCTHKSATLSTSVQMTQLVKNNLNTTKGIQK